MPQFPLRPDDLPVGAPVYVVVFGFVRHWGIVSERVVDGRPTIVSNSYRVGGTFDARYVREALVGEGGMGGGTS